MAAYRRVTTHITCRLTAKNWDQLRNPTLVNRVWATFYKLPFYQQGMQHGLVGPYIYDCLIVPLVTLRRQEYRSSQCPQYSQ